MSDISRTSEGNCSACGATVLMHQRRCPGCGAWMRPWSTGGQPSRWARYEVGGSGRPEDRGGQVGQSGEVTSSVWVRWGPNGEYVRQSTPDGRPAPSGAHSPRRGGATRAPKPPRESRRARKSK